jgi:hypothetical protein
MSADRDARIVTMDDRDDDRLELLDGIADRVPEIDLDQHETEWTTLPDGHEVLLVDGWSGGYFANYGDDLHAYGSLAPILDGFIGCIVIRPDDSRYIARAVPDPLAEKPDWNARLDVGGRRCASCPSGLPWAATSPCRVARGGETRMKGVTAPCGGTPRRSRRSNGADRRRQAGTSR